MGEAEAPRVERATTPDIKAGDDTALAQVRGRLAARRQKAVEELHLDLQVPRLDPPIFVRFRAFTSAELKRISARYEKSKAKDKDTLINAALLATCCEGIYEDVEGRLVSPLDGGEDWPKFDEDLADELELAEAARSATDVVRGLYLTDGDIASTSARLAAWSGYATEEIRDREGN